jgi:MoaA/NifB/PqqE/SkfB family radical SAM enzyme
MTDKTTINEKRQWVRLTRMCNNRCIFCLDADAQNGSVISYREILANLQSGAHYNCSRAVLSGGEPTLHPKFFSVIKYARSIGYSGVQVVTNGRLFSYKGFLEKAINSGVTELTFTIQGHTPRLHDYQTAIKGSFIQSIK